MMLTHKIAARSYNLFVTEGHEIIVAQSFAKNFGLYGERVGALHFVCANADEAEKVDSQLKVIIRAMYSNPPLHGARIVNTILSDPKLKGIWFVQPAPWILTHLLSIFS